MSERLSQRWLVGDRRVPKGAKRCGCARDFPVHTFDFISPAFPRGKCSSEGVALTLSVGLIITRRCVSVCDCVIFRDSETVLITDGKLWIVYTCE